MGKVVIPGECNQLPHALQRVGTGQIELLLGLAQSFVASLQYAAEKRFLAVEIVVEHAIDGARAPADALHARATEPVRGKLPGGGLEYPALHALGVALPS